MILLTAFTISMLIGCGKTENTTVADISETETIAEPTPTFEEVTEPEASEVEETTETEAEEITTTDTETEAVEPEPTPTEEDTKITEMSATMYATQTVNVRSLPNAESDKLGSLSTNDEIQVTGQAENGWYRFDYNGNVAYVSNKYVGDKKVEVAAPANNNSGSGSEASGSTSSNTCPYPLWQPVDNWDKISWYVTQPDPNWETSGHKETQAWMQQTILDRFGDEKWQPGYTVYAQQVTWQYIGTYAEGNVYLQEFAIGLFPN